MAKAKKTQTCTCCECGNKFPLTDLMRVSKGNDKKYACDNCYEEKYAGSDIEDETLPFLKRAEDYFNWPD